MVLGAVFGQSGCEGGLAAGYVHEEISSSVYYLVGWIGFSLVPGIGGVADVRDAVQSFLSGNSLDAALNLAGIVPGPGDGVKVGAAVGFFLGKHPGKVVEVAEVLFKKVFKVLPEDVTIEALEAMFKVAARVDQIKVLDIVFDGAATKLMEKFDFETIKIVAKSNGNLAKTLEIVKRGDGVRWLEEGTEKSGWTHIVKKHISGEIPDGTKFPSSMTEDEVKELVLESIRSGSETHGIDE